MTGTPCSHGGVTISGTVANVGGDKTTTTSQASTVTLNNAALQPIAEAVAAVSIGKRAEAEEKLAAVDEEVSKGKGADDNILANLLADLVGSVSTAVSAVVSAFASPLLGVGAAPRPISSSSGFNSSKR